MDVVVDASVIIAVIANEPEKEALIRLTAGTQLIAPDCQCIGRLATLSQRC